MKIVRLILLCMVLGSCNAQTTPGLKTNKDDNTLLWQISGNGLKQNSYLFGTFHLLCKDDLHFSAQLKQAVLNAKEMYLELDMDDPSILLQSMTVMSMKDGKQLKDFYTEVQYKKLQQYFNDSLQMPLALLQTMKPMLLEAMLYPKMLPCKSASAVEDELMKLAKEDKKEIQGLETMAFQASIFDSIPYEEQAKQLLMAIDSTEKYKVYFNNMLNVYKSQQIKGLEDLINDKEFGDGDDNDILLNNRNRNWVQQLKTIMKKESVFVAVGAGHLVGENGVIALLRKEGYTLTPIENK
jgi:uncharacterized protein YbaP (TraB family)